MKIILLGPGFGHNIQPFLNYFDKNSNLNVDFYYHGANNFETTYKNIKFYSILKNLYFLIFKINKYDVVWLMGGGHLLYIISFFLLFKRRKTQSILHIWGEQLPTRAVKNNFFGKITALAIRNFDIINCNWYGTADILKNKFKKKVQVNVLGLSESYFKTPEVIDPEIYKLLEKIDDKSYNFYYPKSFVSVSRHDLVVEAVSILAKEKLPNFKVYFIDGNAINKERQQEIIDLIKKYKLEETIILLNRVKYFDTENFNILWSKMDCGLQIAEHDQLSNTIFEPLLQKKEIIISDINPYQYIEEYFGFTLELTPLDKDKIADQMRNKILNKNTISLEEKEHIINLIKERYMFDKNFDKTVTKIHKNYLKAIKN